MPRIAIAFSVLSALFVLYVLTGCNVNDVFGGMRETPVAEGSAKSGELRQYDVGGSDKVPADKVVYRDQIYAIVNHLNNEAVSAQFKTVTAIVASSGEISGHIFASDATPWLLSRVSLNGRLLQVNIYKDEFIEKARGYYQGLEKRGRGNFAMKGNTVVYFVHTAKANKALLDKYLAMKFTP